MKIFFTMQILLLCLFLGACQGFYVHYNAGGLREITISDGELVQIHHTLKEGALPVQSLAPYKKNESRADLTGNDVKKMRDWLKRNKLDTLKKNYAPENKNTRSASFHYMLTIKDKGKEWRIEWTGDSKIPDKLQKAIAQLHTFSETILQREK